MLWFDPVVLIELFKITRFIVRATNDTNLKSAINASYHQLIESSLINHLIFIGFLWIIVFIDPRLIFWNCSALNQVTLRFKQKVMTDFLFIPCLGFVVLIRICHIIIFRFILVFVPSNLWLHFLDPKFLARVDSYFASLIRISFWFTLYSGFTDLSRINSPTTSRFSQIVIYFNHQLFFEDSQAPNQESLDF